MKYIYIRYKSTSTDASLNTTQDYNIDIGTSRYRNISVSSLMTASVLVVRVLQVIKIKSFSHISHRHILHQVHKYTCTQILPVKSFEELQFVPFNAQQHSSTFQRQNTCSMTWTLMPCNG